MKFFIAYLNGMREFRRTLTTYYPNYTQLLAYNKGREHAHALTLRRYE